MVRTRSVGFVARLGIGSVLAGIVACSQAPQERLEPPPGYAARPSASGAAAEPVEELTAVRAPHDEDGDGFISPAEAEGFYRRYFGQLDDDDDGRLSRAELESKAPGTPETEVADEELVGATEQEYLDHRLRRYDRRADPPMGMMSTKDFDEMLGGSDPAMGGPRLGSMP
jgi:EF hand